MDGKLKRIQRKRTKDWKMPKNTIYVGRPTIWGNPYPIGYYAPFNRVLSLTEALFLYKCHIYVTDLVQNVSELRGKNLACFCPEDHPCHADILLELANL